MAEIGISLKSKTTIYQLLNGTMDCKLTSRAKWGEILYDKLLAQNLSRGNTPRGDQTWLPVYGVEPTSVKHPKPALLLAVRTELRMTTDSSQNYYSPSSHHQPEKSLNLSMHRSGAVPSVLCLGWSVCVRFAALHIQR